MGSEDYAELKSQGPCGAASVAAPPGSCVVPSIQGGTSYEDPPAVPGRAEGPSVSQVLVAVGRVVGRGFRRAAAPRTCVLARHAEARRKLPTRCPGGPAGPRPPRQPRRTRTERSRCTCVAELALELAPGGGADRLDHPPAGADEDPLLGLGLDPHAARGRRSRSSRGRSTSSMTTSTACGTSWNVRRSTCSRTSSASMHVARPGRSGPPAGRRTGPRAAARTRCSTSAGTPVPVRAETGKISSPTSSVGGLLQRQHGPRAVEPVDLVDRDDHRQLRARAARAAMKRSPGPTPSSPLSTHQRGVGVAELALDAALHALGQRVARALHARAGRRARAACRRVVATPRIARRVVCGLSETIATLRPTIALTSVDLPTFGRPASATKPRRGVTSPAARPGARASRRRRSRGPCPTRCSAPWTTASRRSLGVLAGR